jgi:hypothetical protein
MSHFSFNLRTESNKILGYVAEQVVIAVTLQARIREMLRSNLLAEEFRGFLQSPQEYSGTVPRLSQGRFLNSPSTLSPTARHQTHSAGTYKIAE